MFLACAFDCAFLGSSAQGCAELEPVYAGAIVTAILCDGIAARACIPHEAIERDAITTNGIQTCSTGNRASSLGKHAEYSDDA